MTDLAKPVLYIDMDNTLVDFVSAFPRVGVAAMEEYQDKDDIPGIFALMEPMPGAIEAVYTLSKRYDIYVLSTAPWANPTAWSDKLNWIKRHFGTREDSVLYKRLILSHHKNLNRGAYLVDDRPHARGADSFSGTVLAFGSTEFPDWATVVAHLMAANVEESWDAASQVALAAAIATAAHRGQTDQAGADYIAHPARVAGRFDPVTQPVEHCAAWLHDVIEDTPRSADDLRGAGIHPDVLEVVLLLTRRDDVPSDEYYRRIAAHPRALAVKAADIDDNLDPERTKLLDAAKRGRLATKYAAARRSLGITTNGNPL